MRKFQCLLFFLKRSEISYYIVSVTVSLIKNILLHYTQCLIAEIANRMMSRTYEWRIRI